MTDNNVIEDSKNLKCGFVSVIGPPNAGKSTLMNTLVGTKVSIVSPKVQTTRTIVRGIAIKDKSQIIFIDTPGIFQPRKRFERAMVQAAWTGGEGGDLMMIVLDAGRKDVLSTAEHILSELSASEDVNKEKIVLVLNKVDQVQPEKLLGLSATLNEMFAFGATFMISALKQRGTDDLLTYLAAHMPDGIWHYPEDQISDMPMRMLASEITREKLFLRLHQELPYGVLVDTEGWEEFDNGSVKIDQIVYVTRDNHKGIVLGKGGQQIKAVGEAARKELEHIMDRRVHLKLYVKVKENWQDDPDMYRMIGLDFAS